MEDELEKLFWIDKIKTFACTISHPDLHDSNVNEWIEDSIGSGLISIVKIDMCIANQIIVSTIHYKEFTSIVWDEVK